MYLRQVGFTLIELMLAIAISAILVGLGYPAYMEYQTDAQRDRAEVALMQLGAKLESYFNENDSYEDATIGNLNATALTDGLQYRLVIQDASDSHFEIQAVPIGIQALRDTVCGVLTLSDTNRKDISGSGSATDCWQ